MTIQKTTIKGYCAPIGGIGRTGGTGKSGYIDLPQACTLNAGAMHVYTYVMIQVTHSVKRDTPQV